MTGFLQGLLRDNDNEEVNDQDAHSCRTTFKEGNRNVQSSARLRDYPGIQAYLPNVLWSLLNVILSYRKPSR